MTRQFRRKRAAEWTRFNPDDLAELEETLDVLSDPKALADIWEADRANTADNLSRRADAVRNLSR
jgi:antitoxin YefM